MKKHLLLFVALFSMMSLSAQVTFDYETPETSINFQFFGGEQEGILLEPVDNPNPTGINTSATVFPFTELPNGPEWAGGFSNPDPAGGVDASAGGQVCLDVHFAEANSLTLKLETGQAEDEWEQTIANDVVGEWTTLCYDLTIAGEANGSIAVGKVFNRVVLFIGLGEAAPAEQVVYIDNWQLPDGGGAAEGDVTFSVDMNNYSEAFTTVNVSGTFNDWSGDSNPLSDDDGDGVWTATYPLNAGSYEYKFTIDNWTDEEMFSRTSACTTTFDDGNGGVFTNRVLQVGGDLELPTYCFNSCYACGEGVNITINVAVANPAESGVWLAGGADFGAAGGNYQMSDDDGDNIFSITIEREMGYEGFYTFTNGNCPDYSCKENISGQECAMGDFSDRFMGPVTSDLTISTCFGECTEDTECTPAGEPTMTTFSVDMGEITDINAEGVRIAGQFSNWGDILMTDDDGDGVWTVTIELEKGEYEYKFKNGPEGWETLEANTACTITTPDGQFTNRYIDLTNAEDVSAADVVCFESCAMCIVNTNDLEIDNNLIKLYPTIAQDMMYLDVLTSFDNGTIQIISLQGELMNTIRIGNNTSGNAINVANYPQGTYMLSLTTDTFRSTQRFVKM